MKRTILVNGQKVSLKEVINNRNWKRQRIFSDCEESLEGIPWDDFPVKDQSGKLIIYLEFRVQDLQDRKHLGQNRLRF